MEEAAEICGASGFKKWSSVIIPLIFPCYHLRHGAWCFLNALTELTTSSLLWSAGSETLGVVIYNYTSAGYTTYACALSHSCLHHDSDAGTAVPGCLCHPAS